ncbi:hypothetical protein A0H81_01100 [Grifola frondosa]|uniref:Uncharacterized protein n=1 Tax=Grifola frondosa TaxID=5627 RepID=A0A1C7MV92_GRIFR|nr:hypothetical protein A0H81_01100 [Grifola frondosa]
MSSFPDTSALEHADSAMSTIVIVDGQALQESDFEVATDIPADNNCSSIVSSECNALTTVAGSSMDGAEMESKALAVDDTEAATVAPSVPDSTFRAPSQSLLWVVSFKSINCADESNPLLPQLM